MLSPYYNPSTPRKVLLARGKVGNRSLVLNYKKMSLITFNCNDFPVFTAINDLDSATQTY